MLGRDEFQQLIGKYVREDTEEALHDIDSLMSTYDECVNNNVVEERDSYKEKYENVIREYKDRFLTGGKEITDDTDTEVIPEKYADLFE